MVSGRCRCGGIHYVAEGDPVHSTLCHCSDCRSSAGAPMVGRAHELPKFDRYPSGLESLSLFD